MKVDSVTHYIKDGSHYLDVTTRRWFKTKTRTYRYFSPLSWMNVQSNCFVVDALAVHLTNLMAKTPTENKNG